MLITWKLLRSSEVANKKQGDSLMYFTKEAGFREGLALFHF